MKTIYLFCSTVLVYFFLSCLYVNAAIVLTDEQIQEIATVAEAGGDVAQLAEDMLAVVTADLFAQGLSEEELMAQISIAIQEIVSGLSSAAPGFEQSVNDIILGASSGVVLGVKQVVGADPNLDAGALTTVVANGAARAVAAIQAGNPNLNLEQLIMSVNTGVVNQGGVPPGPEAFEQGGAPDPGAPPSILDVPPPLPAQGEIIEPPELPPTQDDTEPGSPV